MCEMHRLTVIFTIAGLTKGNHFLICGLKAFLCLKVISIISIMFCYIQESITHLLVSLFMKTHYIFLTLKLLKDPFCGNAQTFHHLVYQTCEEVYSLRLF